MLEGFYTKLWELVIQVLQIPTPGVVLLSTKLNYYRVIRGSSDITLIGIDWAWMGD